MMKKISAFVLALVMMLSACALADQTISVTGQATVQLEPDMVMISLGVTATHEEVLLAQEQVNMAMNQVIEALTTDMAIPEEDVATSEYRIDEYWEYNSMSGRSEMIGYNATAMLSIYVRDIAQAGAVIDAAMKAGANQLRSVEFMSSDDSAARDQALTLAVQDGMHKAQVIAKAAGLNLPAVPDKITEESAYSYSGVNRTYAYEDSGTMDTAAATTLQAGLLSITATVGIEYDID